jgi:hypothetical protein
MIAAKGEVTQERILSLMKVEEESLFYEFAQQVARYMVLGSAATQYDSVARLVAEKNSDGYTYDEIVSCWGDEIKLLEDGYTIYVGWASDESGEEVSSWLCNTGFRLEGEEIFITSERGY